MRIVQEYGEIQKWCKSCKSTLAMTVNDIKENPMNGRFYFVCCRCGATNNIISADLPKEWLKKLDY